LKRYEAFDLNFKQVSGVGSIYVGVRISCDAGKPEKQNRVPRRKEEERVGSGRQTSKKGVSFSANPTKVKSREESLE